MKHIRGIAEIVAAAVVVAALCGSLPALGQTAPATSPAEEKPKAGDGKSPDDWRFAATVYV